MIFLTNQIGQKVKHPKKFNKIVQFVNIKIQIINK